MKFFLAGLENTPWAGDAIPANLFTRIDSLPRSGLRVHLCDITFARNKLDRETIHKADFVSLVPSGAAAVAALQGKGFAYHKGA